LTGVLLIIIIIISSVLSHANKAVFSQIGKTLGYFYEVNWSGNYVVAIPVALISAPQELKKEQRSKVRLCRDS